MCTPHKVIGNVHHAGVFNFENRVATNQRDTSTFGDQHHIVSLEKPNKTCQHVVIQKIYERLTAPDIEFWVA